MRKRLGEPEAPVERYETIRHFIAALLEEQTLTAREISVYARIAEKDVNNHLEHIRKTIQKNNRRFIVEPARCGHCNFVFKKRERLTKPGKCPSCHSTLIRAPMFHIESGELRAKS